MDWEGREERVRYSGIADIPALDDTIADRTLESIDEGDKFHDANNPDMPDDPPAAGAVGGAGGGNRGAAGGAAAPAQAAAAAEHLPNFNLSQH